MPPSSMAPRVVLKLGIVVDGVDSERDPNLRRDSASMESLYMRLFSEPEAVPKLGAARMGSLFLFYYQAGVRL